MLHGQEHVRRYRETDGEVGYLWRGVPTLILTTTGRRSGRQRPTPLIFGRDGDDHVVVASKGGAPAHPAWYRNLVDHPEVEVQVKGERFRARARTADGEERARLWKLMTGIWPAYDQYQERTDRRIPVVVLERLPS
ncbi:MAG TPA: nitroreductase family deazaflavin-dependent oxidoreductase [Actinomycetes bacterium]|jgi:deazaflavin-dependent oxidoreductase (nitroreductase family)|nr:nitroreductase family deazaflavin-dependent oxidoreductase [Actinomycetes bacterium]